MRKSDSGTGTGTGTGTGEIEAPLNDRETLTLFDPLARVGGLIHCMLPSSSFDPDKARTRPEMFTDTGVVGETLIKCRGREERL